jgi:hypothetical protein
MKREWGGWQHPGSSSLLRYRNHQACFGHDFFHVGLFLPLEYGVLDLPLRINGRQSLMAIPP